MADNSYVIRPDPLDPRLTERVSGVDQTGQVIETRVTVERALTIFLNSQEIVTAMTINDYPEYLALGYLLNQHMLLPDDVVTGVDYDEELAVVVVRTRRKTDYEKKLKKKVQTSGCAQGTVFGDLMEAVENVTLPPGELRTSWLYALTHTINTTPSLYLEAGAIHGCVLAQADKPLIYMEDVGRHNAVNKIAGYMFKHRLPAHDKIFYTTGRLTSEMVIKTVRMGIPILVSRSGFTAWGVELARKANLTLIGRARGKRFVALAGERASCSIRICATSRKRAPSTGARPPCTMIDAAVAGKTLSSINTAERDGAPRCRVQRQRGTRATGAGASDNGLASLKPGEVAICELKARTQPRKLSSLVRLRLKQGSKGMALSAAQTASPLTFRVPAGSETERIGPTPRSRRVPAAEPSA